MPINLNFHAESLGKKFRKEWIFKNLNLNLVQGDAMAIIGQNGSGKSTLLKVLSGMMPQTEGKSYLVLGKKIAMTDFLYHHINWAAPYIELPDELTVREVIDFHGKFKTLTKTQEEILTIADLENAGDRQIKFLSSGMKQKLKLSLVFFSKSKLLLLDEPTVNLDEKNVNWYQENIKNCLSERITLIGSNIPNEYTFCNKALNIADFKPNEK